LADLNGVQGVRRGVIRITDRNGGVADVDLRTATTVNEVLDAINSQSTARVRAGIELEHAKAALLPRARSIARAGEYGPATVQITSDDGLFTGIDREQPVWMSHGDSITRLPEGFRATAQTDSTPYAGLAAPQRRLYGIQFHPEVVHTPYGQHVLTTFLEEICGCARTWSPASIIEEQIEKIRRWIEKGALWPDGYECKK
jgi:hypothetical protein